MTTQNELAHFINHAALEAASRWITAEQVADHDGSSCLASACFAVGAESLLIHLVKLSGFAMPAPALRILTLTREGLADLHVTPLPPEQHRRALAALHTEVASVMGGTA
jgi:hypothetical protein